MHRNFSHFLISFLHFSNLPHAHCLMLHQIKLLIKYSHTHIIISVLLQACKTHYTKSDFIKSILNIYYIFIHDITAHLYDVGV